MEEGGIELSFNVEYASDFDYDLIENAIKEALKTIPKSIGIVKNVEITDVWKV